jgi:hypothetical protein
LIEFQYDISLTTCSFSHFDDMQMTAQLQQRKVTRIGRQAEFLRPGREFPSPLLFSPLLFSTLLNSHALPPAPSSLCQLCQSPVIHAHGAHIHRRAYVAAFLKRDRHTASSHRLTCSVRLPPYLFPMLSLVSPSLLPFCPRVPRALLLPHVSLSAPTSHQPPGHRTRVHSNGRQSSFGNSSHTYTRALALA